MVVNLVVEIEIFNFCLFVCLFTCLFVPHVLLISQKENGLIMIPKNLLVEIAIYNFDLFHSALVYSAKSINIFKEILHPFNLLEEKNEIYIC